MVEQAHFGTTRFSAYLGVTEPAMYGINLKYKFPMLSAMIGSACAAAICGIDHRRYLKLVADANYESMSPEFVRHLRLSGARVHTLRL